MHVEWYGQSAFALTSNGTKVFIDPFADMSGLADRGIEFGYPPIEEDDVDLLLITHEHVDHNGAEAIAGEPAILRATAGKLESPIGEVTAVASEHDASAGTERGPNTIFAFDLDGVRVVHFGDFGQRELRPEQAAALEGAELLLLPVGGGPTIGGSAAADIVEALEPRLGGADALPHAANRVPGDRGGVRRTDAASREAPGERLRHHRAA